LPPPIHSSIYPSIHVLTQQRFPEQPPRPRPSPSFTK
jgi:hypothetical protein